LKLSVKSDYAVRAVLSLARRYGTGEATRIEEIAQENGIPANYLVQILIELKSGQLVQSLRGKDGGYRLARRPSEISFADVVRCVHGPLFDTPALTDPQCPPQLRAVWSRLQTVVHDEAAQVNFQILAEAQQEKGQMFYI
jgi:Rrf2 family protein